MEPYITVTDAATRLHRSSSTVRRWLQNGRLRGRKDDCGGPGGTWWVSEQSCDQLAAQMTAGVTAQMAATATLQPGGDALTLKVLKELTEAILGLTVELQAQKLLPPASPKKPWWAFWQRGDRQCRSDRS